MKTIVTLWAMAILSYIVIKDMENMTQVAMVLSSAPLGYCYANVKQKEILNKELFNKEKDI